MRIGYVVKRYPRYSETFIVNEILAHEAAGLEIAIFSLRPPNDPRFQEAISRVRAPVTYLPTGGGRSTELWSALEAAGRSLPEFWGKLSLARGEDPSDVAQAVHLACEARRLGVFHLHAHFATVATTVARLAARFAEVSYTFTAHAKDIFHESVSAEDLRRKISGAAAVITVSDFTASFLRGIDGSVPSRVERLYNGLPLARFPFEDPLGRPPGIVAVGRLIEKKGFTDLVDACGLLAERGREFSCCIIGGGPLEEELRRRIHKLGLGSLVELAGPQPLPEVVARVRSASVLAAPCVVGSDGNRDGMPTVLLEAMALGTPCVSTDVTGIPEIVRDGETGLTVPQRDPRALAAAIERLFASPALRRELAFRARRLIEEEFDIRRNAARLRQIFATAIGADPAPMPRAQ
jgi:glycosyltransferase involved in cell wall biosynthesis